MTNVNDFIYPIELSKSPDSIAKRNKQRVGPYLIWLNGDKLGGIYAEKEQQLLIIKYEIIAFINA